MKSMLYVIFIFIEYGNIHHMLRICMLVIAGCILNIYYLLCKLHNTLFIVNLFLLCIESIIFLFNYFWLIVFLKSRY